MKTLRKYFIIVFAVSLLGSCIVDTELKEVPKDFFSPEISFMDKAGFESALADIYRTIRSHLYTQRDASNAYSMLGIDMDITTHINADDANGNPQYPEFWFWNIINKDNSYVRESWDHFYNWIFKANVIIDRAEADGVKWTAEEKAQIVGEAKFLRAFAYHFLANCWGDVPLVLHETTAPKFDYERTPRAEVYAQCKADLTEATQNMKPVNQQPAGRASRAAAYHVLSEVNICLNDYPGAIAAASAVINDPDFYLMTERFGVYKNFTFNGYTYQGPNELWGDVYWDLFQEGNMNWTDGNHEAIWNIELDRQMLGGGGVNNLFVMERWFGTGTWLTTDKNGVQNWLRDISFGRPVARLGQGFHPSEYTDKLIWQYKDDWDRDIRNAECNIQRDYYWQNPNSAFYGQLITPENMANPGEYRTFTAPYYKKVTVAVHHGVATDPSSGEKHDDGDTYKDWYLIRMPETYLLRAEAYLLSGDKQKAADDINVVRNRAKATPVTATDVDIDLILDERARELYLEEFRPSTLMRMGKLVEYLHKYNDAVKQRKYQLPAYKNLWPIPQSVIEANKSGGLTQNPGYE